MAHVEDSSSVVVCWDSNPVVLQLGGVSWCLRCSEKRERSQPVLISEKSTLYCSLSICNTASGKHASDCRVSLKDERSAYCVARKTHCGVRLLLLKSTKSLAEINCLLQSRLGCQGPRGNRSHQKRWKERHCLLLTVSKRTLCAVGNMACSG